MDQVKNLSDGLVVDRRNKSNDASGTSAKSKNKFSINLYY